MIKTIQAVTESNEKHIYYKFGNEYILYEKEMLLSYLKKGNDHYEMWGIEKQRAKEELDREQYSWFAVFFKKTHHMTEHLRR